MSTLEVFWAPYQDDHKNNNWNILYSNPENLYDNLIKNKSDESKTFFVCPSFKSLSKKIYFFENPISTHVKILDNEILPISKNYINVSRRQENSLNGNSLINYALPVIIFASESVDITLTSPYFSYAPHTAYGQIVPGKVNIGKWFRPINFEFNCYSDEFKIEEGEPLGYINFDTDKKIKFHRFMMDETLFGISNTNSQSSAWEKFVPLKKRYERFMKTNTRELTIKNIKRNLI